MYARTALLAGLVGLAACAHATPRAGGEATDDPCNDPQYLALKAQPPDSLTEREYQLLRDREQACVTVQTAAAVKESLPRPASGSAPSARQLSYMIEAHIEPATTAYTDVIRVRNNSNVAIFVTAVWLTDCVGLRTICGLKRMKEPVMAGQDRAVLTVLRDPNTASNYRFTFEYELQQKKN